MVLLPLMIIAVVGDLLLIFQIIRERELFREHRGSPKPCAVIVPLRGQEPAFEKHVMSLKHQDHPDYRLLYVIDEDERELHERRLRELGVDFIVAENECSSCSGKVNAIINAVKLFRNRAIVIADSDTIYPSTWLRDMTSDLGRYPAVTTFTWPRPLRLSLSNLIRSGFWTFGFESQALGGRFLYGGSMAFVKGFFTDEVIEDLKDEWCDDCALTRIVKSRGGRIGYAASSLPINVFDERDLWSWSKKEAKALLMYSRRGVAAFIVVVSVMIVLLAGYLLTLNPVLITPYVLWILKNVIRGRRYLPGALIPAVMSVPALLCSVFAVIGAQADRRISWRGKVYTV
ncbi:MAG: glycosyltransferase [Nitrososphaeria archaeon]